MVVATKDHNLVVVNKTREDVMGYTGKTSGRADITNPQELRPGHCFSRFDQSTNF